MEAKLLDIGDAGDISRLNYVQGKIKELMEQDIRRKEPKKSPEIEGQKDEHYSEGNISKQSGS